MTVEFNPEHLEAERAIIGQIVAEQKWEDLASHGIFVIKRSEDVEKGDCFAYLFGAERRDTALAEIISTYHPVSQPQEGDFVVYYRHVTVQEQRKNVIVHVGKIIGPNGLEESKFGPEGPVVQHHYLLTPFFYGESIVFYRDQRKP